MKSCRVPKPTVYLDGIKAEGIVATLTQKTFQKMSFEKVLEPQRAAPHFQNFCVWEDLTEPRPPITGVFSTLSLRGLPLASHYVLGSTGPNGSCGLWRLVLRAQNGRGAWRTRRMA